MGEHTGPSEGERPRPRHEVDGATVDVAPGVRARPDALRWSFVRSAGPGGQNVNKRSTKAQLHVDLAGLTLRRAWEDRLLKLAGASVTSEGELLLESDEHRTQRRNREACEEKLRALLVEASRPPKVRRPTRPTRGSVQRRLDEKSRRSEIKQKRKKPDW